MAVHSALHSFFTNSRWKNVSLQITRDLKDLLRKCLQKHLTQKALTLKSHKQNSEKKSGVTSKKLVKI